MSGKATGRVWDLELEPLLKFVLLAYADHADHDGANMWPSVALIARKTGYSTRQVQRITRRLESLGWLIEDGQGPRGTNRFKLGGGDIAMSPMTKTGGDIVAEGGGDKNGADLRELREGMSPELNGRTEEDIKGIENDPARADLFKAIEVVFDGKGIQRRRTFDAIFNGTHITRVDGAIVVSGLGEFNAAALQEIYGATLRRALVGVCDEKIDLVFMP